MRLQLQQEENHDVNMNENEENNNRRDGLIRANPSDRASNDLLKSIRKEMDKVENVMKEKMDKNLDGMVKKLTLHSPLVSWNAPYCSSFVSPCSSCSMV